MRGPHQHPMSHLDTWCHLDHTDRRDIKPILVVRWRIGRGRRIAGTLAFRPVLASVLSYRATMLFGVTGAGSPIGPNFVLTAADSAITVPAGSLAMSPTATTLDLPLTTTIRRVDATITAMPVSGPQRIRVDVMVATP